MKLKISITPASKFMSTEFSVLIDVIFTIIAIVTIFMHRTNIEDEKLLCVH